MTHDNPANILVIKLGALGDFIQALGPMRSIRQHHDKAHITLLTTAPFEKMGRDCGYFDNVWVDTRPKFYHIGRWASLARRLNSAGFDRVYDLQNNDRTSFYFTLFRPKPQWSGIARGASHRNASHERTARRAFDGHCQTLAIAGIQDIAIDTLDWMGEKKAVKTPDKPYIMLIPGCSPQHPEKRWPSAFFIELTDKAARAGFRNVIIGTDDEKDVTAAIAQAGQNVVDMTGQTSLYDIAALAGNAACVIGNDTGPMHIAAATGSPCVPLFCTRKSNPDKHGPLGAQVNPMSAANLSAISPGQVWEKVSALAAVHSADPS